MFRSLLKKNRTSSTRRKSASHLRLESLEARQLLAITAVDSITVDPAPANPGVIDNDTNVTSITVGTNVYSNLVGPNSVDLSGGGFTPFWGTADGTAPADAQAAVEGLDISDGMLNPGGSLNMIFSQPINDLDGSEPEIFVFNPDSGGNDETWTMQAIVGGTAASPALGGTPLSYEEADFGPPPPNVGFTGDWQRDGDDILQDIRGVSFDLGDLGLSGGSLIGLQIMTPDGDPLAVIGRVEGTVTTGGTGPGGVEQANGVSNLENWFRADVGVSTSGTDVTAWADQSGRGDDATPLDDGRPTLVNSSSLNNQPALRFAKDPAADDLGFTGVGHAGGNDFSFFAVVQPEAGRVIGDDIGFFLGSTSGGNNTKVGAWSSGGDFFRRIGNGGDSDPGTWPGVGSPEPARIIYLQRDSADDMTSGFDGATPADSASADESSRINRIGGPTNSSDSQDFPGDIAELAFFGDTLNIAERHIVANYLSAKYNLPLDTGSGGLNIYTGDDNAQGDYDLDAFGIGQVDAANRHNDSGSAGFGIRATDASLNDGEFVMAGHKVPENELVTTNVPAGIDSRFERVWYVDTGGSTIDGELAFGFDDAGLPAPADGIDYSLLRSTTDGGAFTIVDTQSSDGGKVEFDVTSLQDGYYTLGVPAGTILAASDTYDADENTPLSIAAGAGVLANDTLPSGSTLTQAQGMALSGGSVSVTTDQGAPLTLNDDGSFDYDPSGVSAFFLQPGDTATDTFTYTVDDNNGTTASGTVTITVTGQFGALDDSYSFNEGNVLSVNAAEGLLANDPLPSGAALITAQGTALSGGSVSVTSDQGAAVTVNDDGSFTFDPTGVSAFSLPPGTSLNDTFTYTVDEGTGDTITATVNVTVTGIAGPVDDSFSVTNRATLSVPAPGILANDAGVLPYFDTVIGADPILYWRLGDADKSDGASAVNSATGPSSVGTAGNGIYHDVIDNVTPGALPGSSDTAANFGTTTASGTTGDSVQIDFGPLATPYPSSQLSLEIWLRSTSSANTMAILSYDAGADAGNNESLLFLNGNDLLFYVDENDVPTGVTRGDIIDGQWHHLAVTYDQAGGTGNLVTYVDGNANVATSSGAVPDNGTFVLAQESDSPGGGFADDQRFIGDLDEFALYDRPLSQEEARAHFLAAPGTMVEQVQTAGGTSLGGSPATVNSDLGASVTVNPDGSFDYDPSASATLVNLVVGATATDTFTYAINGGAGDLETATVTVTVTSVPGSNNDTNSTDEDTPINVAAPGVLANDTGASYTEQVLAGDPIAYYRLGETGGTTADNLGTLGDTADGTYVGSPQFDQIGALGGDLDGSLGLNDGGNTARDYVEISNFDFPTDAFTVEYWMSSSNTNDGAIISYAISSADSNEFLVIDSTGLRTYIQGTENNSGVPFNDGRWHHVVVTWQSSDGMLRLYKDAVEVYSNATNAGSPITPGGGLVFGQEQDSVGGGFQDGQNYQGLLDEVAIYDRVLDPAEIQTHFGSAPLRGQEVVAVQGTALMGGTSTQTTDAGGSVTLNADGSYMYDPSGSATLNALAVGDTGTDSFTYTATTGDGRVATWSFPVAHGAGVETGSAFSPDIVGQGYSISPITDSAGNVTLETISNGAVESSPFMRVDPDDNSADLTQAVANDKYVEFTVTPDSGQTLDLSHFDFVSTRSANNAPRGWGLYSSADGFTTVIDTEPALPTIRGDWTPYRVDLSAAQFQGITGPITFRLYVFSPTDGQGVEFDDFALQASNSSTDSATVTIDIDGVNDTPVADAGGPYTVAEGGSVTLDASASTDPDTGDTAGLTYSWDVNGDGTFGDATGISPTLSFADLQALGIDDDADPANPWQVTVQATDTSGAMNTSAAVDLTLTNAPPVATLSAPAEVVPGFDVEFTVSADDPSDGDDAGTFFYEIDFDNDGTIDDTASGPMSGATFTTQFGSLGMFTVEGYATDKDGDRSAAATFTVKVVPVAQVGDDIVAGGTDGVSDRIIFYPTHDGAQVRYNNTTYPLSGGSFTVNADTRLLAFGRGSSDQIIVAGRLSAPAEFDGGTGNDYLATTSENDTLIGGEGNDILLAGEGDNYIDGGAGNDRMEGRSGDDVIFGGAGSDRLNGNAGDDILDGGADNDFLFGGLGNDLLVGRVGTDTLNGHYGNDVVLGGASSDQLFGSADHDLLLGGSAADRIKGDSGDDSLIGGSSDLDDDIELALDAMLASLGTDLATADSNVDDAIHQWFDSLDRSGFGALADDSAVDDLTGGTGVDEFHNSSDRIRDNRDGETVIP